jgi:hypothetical protein
MGVGLTENMDAFMWGGEMDVHLDNVNLDNLTFFLA